MQHCCIPPNSSQGLRQKSFKEPESCWSSFTRKLGPHLLVRLHLAWAPPHKTKSSPSHMGRAHRTADGCSHGRIAQQTQPHQAQSRSAPPHHLQNSNACLCRQHFRTQALAPQAQELQQGTGHPRHGSPWHANLRSSKHLDLLLLHQRRVHRDSRDGPFLRQYGEGTHRDCTRHAQTCRAGSEGKNHPGKAAGKSPHPPPPPPPSSSEPQRSKPGWVLCLVQASPPATRLPKLTAPEKHPPDSASYPALPPKPKDVADLPVPIKTIRELIIAAGRDGNFPV